MNDTGTAAPETAEARRARLAEGLSRLLSERWGGTVTISKLIETSAGARRGNVLFDARTGDGATRSLCATILPTPDIELMKISEEAALIQLAEAGGVTVPHVHFATEEAHWVGGPLFVSDCVAGETVPRKVLRKVRADGTGARITAQLGAAFAALHAIPTDKAPSALARPGALAPAELAVDRIAEQMELLLQPGPVFQLGLSWLRRHMPRVPARLAIIHGDVRNGNVIIDDSGLAAVLDWEVAKIGDPMEDLAWPCLRCWRFGADEVEVGGFGDRETLAAAYREGGGDFDAHAFHWWKVLGTLRWGLGLAGQARGHLDGSFSNIVMAASGRRVAELEHDLLCLLRPTAA
ncbi:MAG TPA: phosphotransferase family protein [Pseudomonadales bacterium]|nr:phosphotransferase family protein [Pseudomonadales bacterium]